MTGPVQAHWLSASVAPRVSVAAARDPRVRPRVERLVRLAPQGLAAAYPVRGGGFAQTVRRVDEHGHQRLEAQGTSLRYAAIAALGLSRLSEGEQREVLHGDTAESVVDEAVRLARTSDDPGAVAITAWAAAEVGEVHAGELFARMRTFLDARTPLPTVDVSWMLTAAVAAAPYADTDEVLTDTALRLAQRQGPGGTWPHLLAPGAQRGWRKHVGSFADQVYPIQALARASRLVGDPRLLARADRAADRICTLQGESGQWWWWYDTRTGEVVERYPVYSVHQHAMAPMVLLDLLEAGGDDHRAEIAWGLSWLNTRPEVDGDPDRSLIEDGLGLVWRKVGRREPRKLARALNAGASGVRRDWRVPGLDVVLPATVVDHECRPYELGWLLYAWLPRAAATPPTT